MASQFNIGWEDPRKVVVDFTRLLEAHGKRFPEAAKRSVRKGTFVLLADVQRNMPRVTSTAVRSLTARVLESGDVIEGTVGTHIKYVIYLELGTGLFGPKKKVIVVNAKKGKALFWGAFDKDGKPVFRRTVRIRGMKAKRPFGRAVESFAPRFARLIEKELENG